MKLNIVQKLALIPCFCMVMALGCSPDFQQAPAGTTIECPADETVVSNNNVNFTVTAQVKVNANVASNILVEVFAVRGTVTDHFDATNTPLNTPFNTQTDGSGNVTLDIACPSTPVGATAETCQISFSLPGAANVSCSTAFTVTGV